MGPGRRARGARLCLLLACAASSLGCEAAARVAAERDARMWQVWATCPWNLTEPGAKPGWLPEQVRLCATATRGQTLCLAFGVRGPKRLDGVEVLAEDLERVLGRTATPLARSSPLTSEADTDRHVIRASGIDVRIVATGAQPAGRPTPGAHTAPLILLVKRDEESASPSDRAAPGPPRTTIEPGEDRFFWVTIRVPAYVTPGRYLGRLYVSPTGLPGRYLEIDLEVLPHALSPGPRVCAVFYPRLIGTAGRALVVAEFRNLRDHGVNSASAIDGEASLPEAIELRHLMGLRSAVPMSAPLPFDGIDRLGRLAASRGWPPLWALATDPAPDLAALDLAQIDRLRRTGVRVAVVCTETVAPRFRASVDVIVYPLARAGWKVPWRGPRQPGRPRAGVGASGRRASQGPTELYTWDCGAASALSNRLLAGLVLYFSGLDGVMLSGYLGGATAGLAGPTSAGDRAAPGAVLPSRRRPIDTVRWEAVREGLHDYRYLCALERAIHVGQHVPECGETVTAARTFLEDLRRLVTRDFQATLGVMAPDELDRIRDRVAHLWDTIETERQAAPPRPEPLGE